jgi:hypothetical protein
MKCPVNGEEVFPSFALVKVLGDRIIDCPSCGQRHRWVALTSKLVEIEPDSPKGLNGDH